MNAYCDDRWYGAIHILQYFKNAPGKGLLCEDKGNAKIICYSDARWAESPLDTICAFGYFSSLDEIWYHGEARSKTQWPLPGSNKDVEHRAMAATVSKLTWLTQLLQQLNLGDIQDTRLMWQSSCTSNCIKFGLPWRNQARRDRLPLCKRENTLRRNHHWLCQFWSPKSLIGSRADLM